MLDPYTYVTINDQCVGYQTGRQWVYPLGWTLSGGEEETQQSPPLLLLDVGADEHSVPGLPPELSHRGGISLMSHLTQRSNMIRNKQNDKSERIHAERLKHEEEVNIFMRMIERSLEGDMMGSADLQATANPNPISHPSFHPPPDDSVKDDNDASKISRWEEVHQQMSDECAWRRGCREQAKKLKTNTSTTHAARAGASNATNPTDGNGSPCPAVLLLPHPEWRSVELEPCHRYRLVKFVGEHLCLGGDWKPTARQRQRTQCKQAGKSHHRRKPPRVKREREWDEESCTNSSNGTVESDAMDFSEWCDSEAAQRLGSALFLREHPDKEEEDYVLLEMGEEATSAMDGFKRRCWDALFASRGGHSAN